jgi:uncharacterized protein
MSDFFYGRNWEIDECWRLLEQGSNLLILGPRRIGKTQLCRRLLERAEGLKWRTALVDISACEDETGVVDRIESATNTMLQKVSAFVGRLDVNVEGMGSAKLNAQSWEQRGLERFQQLANAKAPALLVIDEGPVFLQRLLARDVKAGARWLHAMRDWRESSPHLRVVMAGSIGLHTLAGRYQLTTAINNLKTFELEAFSSAETPALLTAMASHKQRQLSAEAVQQLMQLVGWHVPHYYDELIDAACQCARATQLDSAAQIDAGLERMLTNPGSFLKHWHDRLSDHGKAEAEAMRKLLHQLARDAAGQSRLSLGQVKNQTTDHHLQLLVDEGYLATTGIAANQHYLFRSGVVRTWWLRKGRTS